MMMGRYWLLALGCVISALAWSDADERVEKTEAERRGELILNEIQGLKEHSWAGTYHGGGWSSRLFFLRLAPQGGFYSGLGGCLGVSGEQSGDVVVAEDRIKLLVKSSEVKRKIRVRLEREYVRVPWGARVYLIPSDQMLEFCNGVNGGTKFSPSLRYLVRYGDDEEVLPALLMSEEEKRPAGLPWVPAEYRAYLLAKSIETEIVEVEDEVSDARIKQTRIVLKAGEKVGLQPGMVLFKTTPGEYGVVEVREVEEDRAEGIVRTIHERPRLGWKFSTRETVEEDGE